MSYEFTKLSEVPAVSEFPEGANAIIETNGEIKRCPSSGGSSVPKPLTYDYMPEGYPTKAMGTVTLLEEQELAFALTMGAYAATLTNVLEIVVGQTYTVNWDGTAYECVCSAFNSMPYLGNLSIVNMGDDTGEPFLYIYNISESTRQFVTTDTTASHTISVKRIEKTVTPMAEEFLPDISVLFIVNVWATNRQQTVFECDKTISEVQAAIESKTSITLRYRDSASNESDFVIYNLSQFSIADNIYEFHNIEVKTTGIWLQTFYIRLENGNMVISRTTNNIVTFEGTTA